jgi:hypothetical protein
MIRDTKFLKKFSYLATDKYKKLWKSGNYEDYSNTHRKKIKNFWDTFEFYGFDKKYLSK